MSLKDKLLLGEKELSNTYIGSLKHVPRLLNIGALIGGPIFIQGDPGTGKSSIVRSHFSMFPKMEPFILSGSRFADKTDLIGFRSLKAYKENDEMIYNVEGTMVTADLIFLDECLEISEKINKLLYPIMYEQEFLNGRERRETNWMMFVGGTNKKFSELTESGGFIDRFVLRTFIPNITDADELTQIRKANRDRRVGKNRFLDLKHIGVTREELAKAREEILKIDIPDVIDEAISNIFIKLNTQGKTASVRRWTDAVDPVLQAVAYLNGNDKVTLDTLDILTYVLSATPADMDIISKALQIAAFNPMIQLSDYARRAENVYSICRDLKKADQNYTTTLSDSMSELSSIREKTNDIVARSKQQNCYTQKLQDLVNSIVEIHTIIATAISTGKPVPSKK